MKPAFDLRRLILAVALVVFGVITAVSSGIGFLSAIKQQLSGIDPLSPIASAFVVGVSIFSGVVALGIATLLRPKGISDGVSSQIENSERRISEELARRLDSRVAEIVSGELGQADAAIERIISERLDNGIIAAVDSSLARRISEAAREQRRWKHIENSFDRIRIKLEGPAERSESRAQRYQLTAGGLAVFGILVAVFRVSQSGDLYTTLLTLLDKPNLWVPIFAQSAPWVGLILLIEFTALLFVRFYLRALELQRYFTKELANMEARFAALRIVLDLGTPEQAVDAARAMMLLEENKVAPEGAGEDMSAVAALTAGLVSALKSIRGDSGDAEKKAS